MARFQTSFKYMHFCLVIVIISVLQMHIFFGAQRRHTSVRDIVQTQQGASAIFYPPSGGLIHLQAGKSDQAPEIRGVEMLFRGTNQMGADPILEDTVHNRFKESHGGGVKMFHNVSNTSDYRNFTSTFTSNAVHNNQTDSSYETMKKAFDWEVKYTLSAEQKSWFGNKSTFPITLDADYLIKPVDLCPKNQQFDYLVVVNSALKNTLRRQVIRQTYGQRNLFVNVNQRVVFLLGTAQDGTTPVAVREEAVQHNDIVQGPFVDHYRNLTHKGVMGLRWISEFCPRVKMVFKIDDDSFLNVFKIIVDLLPQYSNTTRHIGCQIHPKGIRRINREGKWKVEESDILRNLTFYPFDRCNGFFVFVTGDLIPMMFSAARINPYFWIDDAYVFGMLPATVGNVTHVNIWRDLSIDFTQGKDCIMNEGVGCHFYVVNSSGFKKARNNEDFHELWSTLVTNVTEPMKQKLHLSSNNLQ